MTRTKLHNGSYRRSQNPCIFLSVLAFSTCSLPVLGLPDCQQLKPAFRRNDIALGSIFRSKLQHRHLSGPASPCLSLRGGFDDEEGQAVQESSPGIVTEQDRILQRQAGLLVRSKHMFEDAPGGEDTWRAKTMRVLAVLHLRAAALNHEVGRSGVRGEEAIAFVTATNAIIKKFEAATGVHVRRRAEIILRQADAHVGGGMAGWREEEGRRLETARKALRADTNHEEEDEDEEEGDEEETEALISKLAGTVRQFKGAASQNLADLEASHDALDRAMAALVRNIPKASALRREMSEYVALMRKEGALSFYSKMLLIGGTLTYVYVRLKMKG